MRTSSLPCGNGKRAQYDSVNGGKDGGIGADAEREGEDDGEGESRCFQEEAQGRADVEAKAFGERGKMNFPHLLAEPARAPEVNECAPAGFFGAHALGDVGGDHALNVIGDLAIDGIGKAASFVSPESHADLLARGVEDELNRFGEPVPGLFFGGKLTAALGGELVEAGLAAVFRFAQPAAIQPRFSRRCSAG